ncbi:MAG: glycosyltransferase family 2 protein [Candidatus Kryptonium sp.]|nr:glycosyltransferase family 2 protein [Candidatus Kryptonium sp.]MCX7763252.1 glycosyltransferase family 2 protein [Candidatus Kryptonium sp.]MDW8109139.1 glycosyltransferase family 2 protein [Candidatus Kryptonium sp.]
MLDLTISIVNYDTSEMIVKCLDSIFKFTKNLNFEVIVVDNGSSDGSPEIIAERFPSVKLIKNQQNEGFARAHNKAFKLSSSKYFVVLNSDVVIEHNAFKELVDFMEKNPDVALLSPKVFYPDGRIQDIIDYSPSIKDVLLKIFYRVKLINKEKFHAYSPINFNYNQMKILTSNEYITGCCYCVRREHIKNDELFDEKFSPVYFEDTDLCARLINAGFKVVYYPKTYVIHHHGYTVYKKRESNYKDFVNFRVIYRLNRYYYFRKHKGYIQEILVRLLDFAESLILLTWRLPKWFLEKKQHDRIYLEIDFNTLKASLGLIKKHKLV